MESESPAPRTESVPDVVGVVEGWRAWRIDGGFLSSLLVPVLWVPGRMPSHRWRPGEAMEATCDTQEILSVVLGNRFWAASHRPPDEACSCGIYAFSSRKAAWATAGGFKEVFGKVSLWGGVVPHERGWRAELAYPAVVFMPPWLWLRHGRAIASRYGIQVKLDLTSPWTPLFLGWVGAVVTLLLRTPPYHLPLFVVAVALSVHRMVSFNRACR